MNAFQPIRRSPLHHVHEQHRARFIERDGWIMPAGYIESDVELEAVRTSVGICDISFYGKIEVKGAQADQVPVPVPGSVYRIHDCHSIVICAPADTVTIGQRLEAAAVGKPGLHIIPNSSAYGSVLVTGPVSENMLRKLSTFNFTSIAPRGHAVSAVARVRTLIIRDANRFELHFSREFAEYIFMTLLDAGREFGIQPFGLDTLARL